MTEPTPADRPLRLGPRPPRRPRPPVRRAAADPARPCRRRWTCATTARRSSTTRGSSGRARRTRSAPRSSSPASGRRPPTSCRRGCSSTTTSGSSRAPSPPTAARRSATGSRGLQAGRLRRDRGALRHHEVHRHATARVLHRRPGAHGEQLPAHPAGAQPVQGLPGQRFPLRARLHRLRELRGQEVARTGVAPMPGRGSRCSAATPSSPSATTTATSASSSAIPGATTGAGGLLHCCS